MEDIKRKLLAVIEPELARLWERAQSEITAGDATYEWNRLQRVKDEVSRL